MHPPETCYIHYSHYYDELGSQFVIMVLYEPHNAIEQVWSGSASLEDEETIKQLADRQLERLLERMDGEGWRIVTVEESQTLDSEPRSVGTVYLMRR